VAQVEIGFSAVVGDEDFARAGTGSWFGSDVEIRIEFLQRDLRPRLFEQAAEASPPQSLPGRKPRTVTKMYLDMFMVPSSI